MQPPLPKPPSDEENLRRLRQQAAERMARENYPSPPMPVYGGPPIRRWTVRGFITLILSTLAALIAGLWAFRKITTPVYGGPPAPVYGGPPVPPPHSPQQPSQSNPPAPVYGGPPPPQPPPSPSK